MTSNANLKPPYKTKKYKKEQKNHPIHFGFRVHTKRMSGGGGFAGWREHCTDSNINLRSTRILIQIQI
jgi:hypothetical protein